MTETGLEVSLTAEEVQQIFKDIEHPEILIERTKTVSLVLSYIVKGVRGEPPEADDVITRLINVKNILERSRFPTYPILAKQVYLRLIAFYHPTASSCEKWANLEAEALTEYKGQGRQEYVDMARAQAIPTESQQFYFGPQGQPPSEQPVKRRFWQRKPKPEETEFVHQ